MTKATVHAGVCGFLVTIRATKKKSRKIQVSLDTECEMIKSMEDDISLLDVQTLFSGYRDNPVFCSASKRVQHVSCPVTSAILKTIEVEAGLALPRDVSITFLKD